MTDKETPTAATPRWVKVFGITALVVVVLVVVMLIAGRGEHGPGRHASGGGASWDHAGPPPGVTQARR